MPARSLALIALLAAGRPACADPGCGGDAFSSAQVLEGRAPRRGPLTAVPDTLCADLADRRPADMRIDVYPLVAPQAGPREVGPRSGGDPYEGPSPRPRRP